MATWVDRSLRFEQHGLTGNLWVRVAARGLTHVRIRLDRAGEQVIVLDDPDVPPPRVGLGLRAEGLWTELICETPFEHWSYGLEAFALLVDDPDDAAWGDRVAFGWELEWETVGEGPVPDADRGGYHQEGGVTGIVLVGSDRIEIDGSGRRRHRWPPPA